MVLLSLVIADGVDYTDQNIHLGLKNEKLKKEFATRSMTFEKTEKVLMGEMHILLKGAFDHP